VVKNLAIAFCVFFFGIRPHTADWYACKNRDRKRNRLSMRTSEDENPKME